ncbi:hypothetical protein Scep_002798 [Stephania cephalantha]|uniref:Uncharacterized protein n=1 Tax=Stephania cephalantha TaxID=152367 RepID=A0AAP0LAJ5_9MAGN
MINRTVDVAVDGGPRLILLVLIPRHFKGHGFICWVGRLFKEGRVGAIRGERQGGEEEGGGVNRYLIGGGAYARETEERRCGGLAGARKRPQATAAAVRGGISVASGTWRKNSARRATEEGSPAAQ